MESAGCAEDFSLIREAQRGNHAAFERLIYAHDQSVLRLALQITGTQSDAQDIYQETFLKVFKKLGSFRNECSFSTWIYRIATNAFLDHLRKKDNRRETSAAEVNADGEEYDLMNQFPHERTLSTGARTVAAGNRRTHFTSSDQTDTA